MCLGLIALGVTALRGQDEAEKPKDVEVIVVEGQEKPAAEAEVVLEPVRKDDLKRIEISIGEDGKSTVVTDGEHKNVEVRREGGGVIILNEDDGRVIRKIQLNPQEKGPVTARLRLADGQVIDPATREALERLMVGLKEEAGRLGNEGKKEEAERKLQSLRAIESLLNPGAGWKALALPSPQTGLFTKRGIRIEEGGPAAEEMKKLRAHMEELHAQLSRLPEGDKEGRVKLEHAMRELKTQIGERQRQFVYTQAGPNAPGALVPGQPVPAGGGIVRFDARFAGPSPEADALARKSAALNQAAAQLSQAGLEDQAAELRKQAEKLRAESEKIRAETAHAPHMIGIAGAGPMELHRSIHELQEQVQQLRKEVAELRDLLQKRQ
jgi:hypothetical protein